MRREYRSEAANNGAERYTVAADLAPDGWGRCRHRVSYLYVQRPRATGAGPVAALTSTPRTPNRLLAPGHRYRGRPKQPGLAAVIPGTVTFAVIRLGGQVSATPILTGAAIAAPVAAPIGGCLSGQRVKRDVTRGWRAEAPGPAPRHNTRGR